MGGNSPKILLGIMILCIGVSCANSRRPWIEDGERLGTIYVVKDGASRFYAYRDSQRRLIRRERHLRNGDLDPFFAIENYRYDVDGHETDLSFTNRHGELIPGPSGYAMRRTERRRADDSWLVDHRHYDPSDSPILISSGYHREEVLIDRDNRMTRRRFYDQRGEPIGADLEHASGIVEVRYKRLMGTTPIVYETFIGADGKPVLKRKLSGRTRSARTSISHYHHHRYHY